MAQYSFERLRPEYDRLWAGMQIVRPGVADQQARRVIASKGRYLEVERATGVPWFVVGCLHMRESNGDFTTYLGNGQPLNRVTTIVPKGRGPWPTFLDGAVDALRLDGLDQVKVWTAARVAYALESFNGFGYRHPNRNIPSPYLWGGTSVQKPGKFVRDGVYDPTVMDTQVGGMAVLKCIMEMDATARFGTPVAPISPAEKAPPVPGRSPKADDDEAEVKPLTKSKTIWGNVISAAAGVVGTVSAAVQGVPPWAWVTIGALILVGGFLVYKGRLDVQAVLKHLSQDDTQEAKP